MSLVVSGEDVSDIDTLLGVYKALPGNEDSDLNSFYQFLFQNTAERAAFLEKYCDYSYIKSGATVILKVNLKAQ